MAASHDWDGPPAGAPRLAPAAAEPGPHPAAAKSGPHRAAGDRLVVGSPCQFWTDCLRAALRQHLAWDVIAATGGSRRLLQVAASVQARALLLRLDRRERAWYRNRRPANAAHSFAILAIDELPRPRPATVLHEGRFNWVPCHWSVGDLAQALAAWTDRAGPDRAAQARAAQAQTASGRADEPWGQLTRRELDVCRLLARGCSVRECARQLGLRPSTVDNHKTHLMRKLGVHKTTELVRLAIRDRLVDLA